MDTELQRRHNALLKENKDLAKKLADMIVYARCAEARIEAALALLPECPLSAIKALRGENKEVTP